MIFYHYSPCLVSSLKQIAYKIDGNSKVSDKVYFKGLVSYFSLLKSPVVFFLRYSLSKRSGLPKSWEWGFKACRHF